MYKYFVLWVKIGARGRVGREQKIVIKKETDKILVREAEAEAKMATSLDVRSRGDVPIASE